jgi:RND family efflux transporter MFP subunit
MKHTFQIILFAFVVIVVLTSCSPSSTVTPIPPVFLETSDTSAPRLVKASGVAVPIQEAHLSFVISGVVEDLNVAEGDHVLAGQVLAKLDTSELDYDVISAEAALTIAEFDAQIVRQRKRKFDFRTLKIVYVDPPGEKILEAEYKVEQSQFAVEVAKASLAQGTLLAPFNATVVSVSVMPGEYVQTSQVVLELADLSNLQIETTDLSELNIATVKIGQPATVFIEALGDEFPGKVIAIAPISNTIGGDVVFKVTIQLDEQPQDLLWGMSTDVEINVE